MLAAAETKEADAAHAQEIDQAREAITRFNHWLATEYAPHAAAIAAGIALERRAIALRERLRGVRTGTMPEGLLPLALAHVGADCRGLGFLVRLPSTEPGTVPPAWPR